MFPRRDVVRTALTQLRHLCSISNTLNYGHLARDACSETRVPRPKDQQTRLCSTTNIKHINSKDCVTSRTVGKCTQELTEKLQQHSILEPAEAKSSAEYIVAHVCGYKTISAVSAGRVLTAAEYHAACKLTDQRLQSVPLQYVLGEWDFLGHSLVMRQPVFIPRPETEELVNHCLSNQSVQEAVNFLEIGSGSGAISISLLNKLPQCQATCIDQSEAACELTRENAELNGVSDRLKILHCLFNKDISVKGLPRFDFIISNPPYIPSSDMESLPPEIKLFEDSVALDGGPLGLDVINDILYSARNLLKPSGSVWLETDSSHPEVIRDVIKQNPDLQLRHQSTLKDFQGIERFVRLIHEAQ